MADFEQKINALKGLVGVLNSMDDGQKAPTAGTRSNPPAVSGQRGKYKNSGTQRIKGLTNQTGRVEGNGNGAINFGAMET